MTPNGTAESLRRQLQERTAEERLGQLRSKRLGRVAYDKVPVPEWNCLR